MRLQPWLTLGCFSPSRSVNVHARGQGLQNLALVDQDELEKKRLKTLEHQVKIFINVFPIVSSV